MILLGNNYSTTLVLGRPVGDWPSCHWPRSLSALTWGRLVGWFRRFGN